MAREELHSIESVLDKYVPGEELAEVKRILFGNPAECLELSEEVVAKAGEDDYEISGWRISALAEETRPPREVKIGLIQNKIVLPTDAPIQDQVSQLRVQTILLMRDSQDLRTVEESWGHSRECRAGWSQYPLSAGGLE